MNFSLPLGNEFIGNLSDVLTVEDSARESAEDLQAIGQGSIRAILNVKCAICQVPELHKRTPRGQESLACPCNHEPKIVCLPEQPAQAHQPNDENGLEIGCGK